MVAWNRQTEEKKQSRRKILETDIMVKSYGENGDFIIACEPEPHKIVDGKKIKARMNKGGMKEKGGVELEGKRLCKMSSLHPH